MGVHCVCIPVQEALDVNNIANLQLANSCDDIYVTASLNGNSYDFCVEVYLTGEESDVYTTVGELQVGDVVDIEGFLYWYADAMNPHITAITKN